MAYTKTNWENFPSANTPINAENLNKMEEGIANAVEKTGDTMTGSIMMLNTSGFDVIRKTRTIEGEDYQLVLGLGGNKSARLEFVDNGNNVLNSFEVRPEGLWNGVANRRVPEVAYCAWNNTFTFSMKGGHSLVMINNTDCLMLWVGGSYPNQNLSTVRLYGTEAQVSFNVQNQTVTISYANSRNFTCTAFVSQ